MHTSIPPAIALASALALLSPADALASACCGTGHGIGQRLADTEDAALVASFRGASRIGAWTSSRDFDVPGEGDFDRELRGEIGWLVRVKRRFELGVTVPFLSTWKQAGELAAWGGGVSDVTALGRINLRSPSASRWLPGVALTLGALIPTGRGAQASEDILAADTTGLGAAEVRPGVVLEKTWVEGWFATLALSAGFRRPFTAPSGTEVRLAPRWQVVAAGGPSWPSGLSFSLGLLYEREGGPALGGVVAPDTTRERTAAIAFAAYDIDARWAVIASSQIDAPISGFGRNEPASAALSFGLRRAWGLFE